jgi:two-component system phosphate regulon response regulator PhoB
MNEYGTILIVDDNTDIRDLLTYRLKTVGYNVVASVDGEEALGPLTEGSRPDIVVSDIQMQLMEGIELSRLTNWTHRSG